MRQSILAKILDFLFPRFCPVCGGRLMGEEEKVCISCLFSLPSTTTWKSPYENEMTKMFWVQVPIEKCCALFYYSSHAPSSNILYQLKYHDQPELGVYMGELLAQEGERCHFFDDIDAIIPIPLAPKRLRQRGYNQSLEIAKGISKQTHIPIIEDAAIRTIFQSSQTDKARQGRFENVKHVFDLAPKYKPSPSPSIGIQPSPLAGKHLLVIDDVCTTGATIIACCQAIMRGCNIHAECKNEAHLKFSVLTIGWAKG